MDSIWISWRSIWTIQFLWQRIQQTIYMLRSNRRDNKQLSRDLRELVCENIGKEIQRAAWQRTNGSTDQREISILCKNVRERVDLFSMQDEHFRKKCRPMLDSRKSEVLATNILARLQAQTTASFEEHLPDEQGIWPSFWSKALPDWRDWARVPVWIKMPAFLLLVNWT